MDPINIEKMLAMNNYKKKNQFLNHLFFYTFTAMTCSLFCTSHLWFPSLYSSLNVFLFVSLPNIRALIFNPKFLFVVCNIIVVFLIGESKIVGSKSSPATEIYEEYVTRSRNLQTQKIPISTPELVITKNETKLELPMIKEETGKKWAVVEKVEVKEEVKEVVEEEEPVEVVEEEEEEEESVEVVEEEEEEEFGLPAEELNKRVEDFIERMKQHRRFEAGILVCSKA